MAFPSLYKNIAVSPPSSDFFIDTLEFHHSSFAAPEKLVNQPKDYVLTLESTALINPNQAVIFTACPFDLRKPQKGDQGRQAVDILIPNVDRRLTSQMDRARGNGGAITCFWRTYAKSQITSPIINPPPKFQIKSGNITVFEIRLTATFFEFFNDKFPGFLYSNAFAPGLQR